MNVLLCHSHLGWLVFDGSIAAWACFHSGNFLICDFILCMVRHQQKLVKGTWLCICVLKCIESPALHRNHQHTSNEILLDVGLFIYHYFFTAHTFEASSVCNLACKHYNPVYLSLPFMCSSYQISRPPTAPLPPPGA